MSFYLKCVWFLWILGSILIAENDVIFDTVESKNVTYINITTDNVLSPIRNTEDDEWQPCSATQCRITNLDHSNVLINMDLTKNDSENTYTSSLIDIRLRLNKSTLEYYPHCSEIGQTTICKLSSLKENTTYQVEVYKYTYYTKYTNKSRICLMKINTTLRTSELIPSKPEFVIQPDLEYLSMVPYKYMRKEILWFPCGRKGYCEADEVPGSYFSVKFKMLYSRQVWKIYEYNDAYTWIYDLLPGRPYEVVVTSIRAGNINHETDSDPQEILIKPVCSPVQSVKIISLTNSSVFISWKLPAQCSHEVDHERKYYEYLVKYRECDDGSMVVLNSSDARYQEAKTTEEYRIEYLGYTMAQKKISNLTPNTCYTFHILLALKKGGLSFDYTIDHIPRSFQENLSLAKPEFQYALEIKYFCRLKVYWLPCGETSDCKGMKPGSYFSVKYRNTNVTDASDLVEIEEEITNMYVKINLQMKQIYKFFVESWDENNNRKLSKEQMIDASKCETDENHENED